MKKVSTTPKQQRGVVLVTSLIMLLVMTLIGITGMQTTMLEEKMAGNYNDQNIAFQAAESTLIEAEELIMSWTFPFNMPNVGGLFELANEPANYLNPALWSANGSSKSADVGFGARLDIPHDPRYVITRIDSNPLSNVSTFRITARALGKSPGTQVILQEIYERTN